MYFARPAALWCVCACSCHISPSGFAQRGRPVLYLECAAGPILHTCYSRAPAPGSRDFGKNTDLYSTLVDVFASMHSDKWKTDGAVIIRNFYSAYGRFPKPYNDVFQSGGSDDSQKILKILADAVPWLREDFFKLEETTKTYTGELVSEQTGELVSYNNLVQDSPIIEDALSERLIHAFISDESGELVVQMRKISAKGSVLIINLLGDRPDTENGFYFDYPREIKLEGETFTLHGLVLFNPRINHYTAFVCTDAANSVWYHFDAAVV